MKYYIKPTTEVYAISLRRLFCASVTTIQSDSESGVGITYDGRGDNFLESDFRSNENNATTTNLWED